MAWFQVAAVALLVLVVLLLGYIAYHAEHSNHLQASGWNRVLAQLDAIYQEQGQVRALRSDFRAWHQYTQPATDPFDASVTGEIDHAPDLTRKYRQDRFFDHLRYDPP